MHRIVGALSATSRGGIYAGLDRFAGAKQETFGQEYETEGWLDQISEYRLVFFGEVHSIPQVVDFQQDVMKRMASNSSKLHVVMEHFSFDMQSMLEDYQNERISFEELIKKYQEVGTEKHNLRPYKPLLEEARRSNMKIKLHAGFLSRTYVRQLVRESEQAVIHSAAKWLQPSTTSLEGSDFHYNVFESMLSGRNVHSLEPPKDRFQGIFKAQLLKDMAMAYKLNSLIRDSQEAEDEKFLVIAGNGHIVNYQGVPERVLKENPSLIDKCCLITSHEWEGGLIENTPEVVLEELEAGPPGANPADFMYVYEDFKSIASHETLEAYNKVGETAHIDGNSRRAKAIMKYLGYSPDQINVAGSDAFNYQGVGNPHKHARIQPGEIVLDIGSGLGIDSFIAAHHTGVSGKVIGIDISKAEVDHAQERAYQQGLDIRFAVANMESIPLPDNSIDVIISNGAFCLAPNKERAFEELFRVLKPGGRISVCTSTIQPEEKLQDGVKWPLCMKMFIEKDELLPMCQRIGFTNVIIDDTDSKMVYELPEEEAGELNPDRHQVHGDNGDEFEHLEGYDMDELCARVVVVARKPMSPTNMQEAERPAEDQEHPILSKQQTRGDCPMK